jgi:hypothetical protein
MITNMSALSGQNDQLKAAVRRVATELAAEEDIVWGLRRAEISLWQEHAASARTQGIDELVGQSEALLAARLPLMLAEIARLDAADVERDTLRAAADRATETVRDRRERFESMEDDVAKRIVSGPEIAVLAEHERKLKAMIATSAGWRDELSPLVDARLVAYDADPVFSYLRDRGFGTGSYAARWPLSRIDALVAKWSGFIAAAQARDMVAGYVESYASHVANAERALAAVEPRRQAMIARIKSELEPVRETLALALISTSDVVDRFASCTARKALAVSRLRDFAAGRDKAYEMATEAVVMATARERASAALRSEDPSNVGPASQIAKRVEENVRRRLESGRRADGVRRNLLGLLDRLEAVQAALDKAASGEIDPQELEFLLASNEVELA